jgi:LysM repeat protein
MDRKHFLFIILTAILMLVLVSACVRPASTPPSAVATSTAAGEFPVPGATDDVMSQLEQAATQTLMAMQGTPQVQPTNPTVEGTPAAPSGQETAAVVQPTTGAEATAPAAQATNPPPAAPATATIVPLPSPTPGKPSSWTLQTGEFPYCLARRYDVNPSELLRLNGLSQNSFFYAGMVLKIPQTGETFPGSRSLKARPTNYTVSSGDNIYSIACQFGDVDPYAIAAANGMVSPYNLNVGQSLYIP